MQIVCPHCETSYRIDASAVGPTGRSVRCVRCRTVWFAANTEALADIAASHRAEMAQFATAGEPGAAESWPEPEAWTQAREAGGGIAEAVRADIGVSDAPPIAGDHVAEDLGPTEPLGTDAPKIAAPALAPVDDGEGVDIETVAARRAPQRARKRGFAWPWSLLPTAVLGLFLLDASLIIWRVEMVRLFPQTASLYAAVGLPVNLRGLVLTDVTAQVQTGDGAQVLTVQGQIVSAARRTVEVPRLRLSIRNSAGNEIYNWTALPGRSLLSPGETLGFQSRLAAPPPETREVVVRFFNRHDLATGAQ